MGLGNRSGEPKAVAVTVTACRERSMRALALGMLEARKHWGKQGPQTLGQRLNAACVRHWNKREPRTG